MMIKKADQESILKLLNNLKNDYNIAAPVLLKKGKKEIVEYVFIDDLNDIYLDRQPDSSPKNIVFPQNSAIGKDYSGDKLYDPEKKTILWGVRSCDIEAIKTIDQVFIEDEMYTDQSYKANRDKTIIVGLSCEEREKNCFCDALGFNPIESDYAPIYLFIKEDQYYIKIKEKEYESLFSSLFDGDQTELNELLKLREKDFNSSEFEIDIPIPLPEKDIFEAEIWDEMSEKCLSCGVCTYYCPTCYCFNFFWDGNDHDSTRYKNWDSCMFTTYSAHASGHNPRDSKDKRYRNRIMHKFSYHPFNYEGLGCVGCGRCISRCPVNLDIREALKLTEKYLQTKGGAKKDG
ncbi:MAG: 4Fe-4S dicluster domain-containing protein [Halanaerobiales bacterium]|nr:4Fe-4S dicluster domain-containing protein [Halanaerobiales bacterium]